MSDYQQYSILGQLKIYTRVVRSGHFLTYSEEKVLLFILDRTIGCQRVRARISLREFENGIKRRFGGQNLIVVRGTGLSAEQVTQAASNLRDMGAIEIFAEGQATSYRINETWALPEFPRYGRYALWEVGNDADYVDPPKRRLRLKRPATPPSRDDG